MKDSDSSTPQKNPLDPRLKNIGPANRYSFFQLVRTLLAGPRSENRKGIGDSTRAGDEPLRFRTHASLQFPNSEVLSLKSDDDANDPLRIDVNFWGLIGSAGALPTHYSQLVLDRSHAGDHTLQDFLDIFSHRQLSLFYRAWEKTFPVVGQERSKQSGNEQDDLLREILLAIVGFGTPKTRRRFDFTDDTLVYYGGHLLERPSVDGLQSMLRDWSGLKLRVISLFGQWLRLPVSEQSRMPTRDGDPALSHCRLGQDMVLGDRVWNAASKFRVVIGPVDLKTFTRLTPSGDWLRPLAQLTRSAVGMSFDFDFQVILLAAEIPELQFPSQEDSHDPPRLGWNTWLLSQAATTDSDDAVFVDRGEPNQV